MCISKGQLLAVFESSFENLRKMHNLGCEELPVYSVLDVTEDVVDPFSQSFSPFLLLERLGDRKPSAESGLQHKMQTQNLISGSLFCEFAAFNKSTK